MKLGVSEVIIAIIELRDIGVEIDPLGKVAHLSLDDGSLGNPDIRSGKRAQQGGVPGCDGEGYVGVCGNLGSRLGEDAG